MKNYIVLALLTFSASAFATGESGISVIDRMDSAALMQINGEAAQVIYNSIKYGQTSVTRGGPARASLREEVVGESASCLRVRARYSCRIIVIEGGKLLPERSVDLN